MIRMIGTKEDPHEYLNMCMGRLNGMEELAATHITWYTHKNPYGCWICDLFLLTRRLGDTFGEFLGPGSEEKDIGIVKSSTEPESSEGGKTFRNGKEIVEEEDSEFYEEHD